MPNTTFSCQTTLKKAKFLEFGFKYTNLATLSVVVNQWFSTFSLPHASFQYLSIFLNSPDFKQAILTKLLTRSKTFHVEERVRARDAWKFFDASLGRRANRSRTTAINKKNSAGTDKKRCYRRCNDIAEPVIAVSEST